MFFFANPGNTLRQTLTLVALLMAFAFGPQQAFAQRGDVSDGFADLADRLIPTVVNISTTTKVEQPRSPFPDDFPGNRSPFEEFFRDFFENRPMPDGPRRAMSLGSGFVIDAEQGYIVTNNHVIDKADEIRVVLSDDRSVKADVIGKDEKTDLAVLQIDTDGVELQEIEWGNSERVRVGDWIIAIGNPFGLGGTVTSGIISARARNINAGPYDDFLQTDASINRGNSGGPMFGLDGKVVGINTAIYSPTGGSVGIGFAIPSDLAKPVIDQLIEFGRTRRGWLGVRIQEVTPEIAESLGLDQPRGALVAEVTPEGPAEDAGIKTTDIILSFDGKKVAEMRELPRIVAETDVGAEVPVEVWRDGERERVEVEVGELEKAEEEGLLTSRASPELPDQSGRTRVEALGLQLSAMDEALVEEFGLDPETQGVVITAVDEDSEAWQKRLRPGDVIREFNQQAVTSPDAIQTELEKIRAADGQRNVLIFVEERNGTRFVTLQVDKG